MCKRLALMLAVALGGCAGGGGSGSVGVQYAAAVTVRSPELVTVDGYDDVYVVADADEPVFYSDDYYWLYRNDRWYRSHSYDRDYVYVSEPAPRLRRISQPTAYTRYRSRHQEARVVPRPAPAPRDPWRNDYSRPDAPSTLPPHQQQPLQPTQPQQPVTPYPRPPQQEPVTPSRDTNVRVIEPPHPVTPAQPPVRDIRPTPPGHDNRPVTPPGQRERERAPGPPANHDVRDHDRDRGPENRGPDRAREDHPPKAPPANKHDDDKHDKKDKKHDH